MKNFILALLLGFSAMAFSQNSLSGIISDNNGVPLIGVSVYAPDINKGTITDDLGNYLLKNIPSGSIKITFSYIGYSTQNKIVIVSNSTISDVILVESVHQMDEVIVSTAFNKLQSQNVMKVEHASIKSLAQKGISTLIEGLATIPGVSQISTGTSIGKPVIRGLSGNRVLVYSQGVRLENQQFGDEHGLGLNDSGIESVEVIKGPASLLYGSDALGGVLYFNPEKFADANSFKADFSQKFFSNTLGSNSSFGVKGSSNKWKFLARGSYSTHSDYQIASISESNADRVTNTRYNETDFKGGIGFSDSQFASVLRYNFNRLDIGIPEDGIAQQSDSKKTKYPKQGVDNHIVSLHNNFFFANSTLDANIGYIGNDRSEFEDNSIAVLEMKLQTLNYDFKYHLPKSERFAVVAGIQGMTQSNKNSGEEYLIPDATTDDFGIFTTANYSWKTNVLQAGLRFDNRKIQSETNGILGEEGYFAAIDKSYNSINASVGYKTDISEKLRLRVNVASGFRAPNLAELTSNGVHEGTNRYEIGNSNLGTEQNIQTDINFEYKNSHFEFFVNGFYNKINDYIYASPTGAIIDENNVYAYIQEDAALFGGEAGIHFHPHPLDWLHFESSFETVTGKKDGGDYLPLVPANNWNNTIRTEFAIKDWMKEGYARMTISTAFSQNNVSGFETPTNDYTLVNLGFGGKITVGTTVFNANLNANNVFDKAYISHLSRLKVDGIPNIGRNIILGLNFNI